MEAKHTPKVSICIPAYREVAFLKLTLESIRQQSYSDYEVIVTDDSPDDSVECLVRTFPLDGKLRYQRNPAALGSPENWNECIRQARGEFIKIMHHDDCFAGPDSLARFVSLLERNPASDFGFSATRVDDVTTGRSRIHRPTEADLARLAEWPPMLFAGNVIGAPSATIYRRGIAAEYDIKMKWLVDLDFYIRVLAINPKFAFASEALIRTPTNAPHQVTEICRDNAKVELFEYSRLFSKMGPACHGEPEVAATWRRLFAKYRIRKLVDFQRRGVDVPVEHAYFEVLLARPPSRWLRLRRYSPRQELLRLFYRVYPRLPSTVRTPLRWIKNRVVHPSGR